MEIWEFRSLGMGHVLTYNTLATELEWSTGVEAGKGDQVEATVHGIVDANDTNIPAERNS